MRTLRLAQEAVVDARAGDVYDLVANPEARPAWLHELRAIDARAAAERVRPGDRFDGRAALLGHEFAGRSVVHAADGASEIVEDVVIGARFTSHWTMAPAGDGGTRIRHVVEIEFPRGPLGGIARRLMGWRLRRMQRSSLQALAQRATGAGT